MTERIEVARIGDRWAVKHEGGYLGLADSREEGARIARHLIDWLQSQGRTIQLVIGEQRSFSAGE